MHGFIACGSLFRMNVHERVITAAIAICICGMPAAGQHAAISAAIVLDTSGSMGDKMALARRVASELVKTAGPLDELAVIQAADRPVVLSGFTAGADPAQAQIAAVQPRGRSGLLDAIYLAAQLTKAGKNARKVVIVVSDGDDNSSRYTMTEVKYAVREAGARVFVIGMHDADAVAASLSPVIEYGNGRQFTVDRSSNLLDVVMSVTAAMRSHQ